MRPVVLESPYAGDVERNLRYLRAAMRLCLLNGEAPFASHAIYTQPGVLDDTIPAERELGIRAGFVVAEALAWAGAPRLFFVDEGESKGMAAGMKHARGIWQPTENRIVPGWAESAEVERVRATNRAE
jgi:hypothetical protein